MHIFKYIHIFYEQSWKLRVHGKDIYKFGKVPSLPTRLHKNHVWQTWGVLPKGKLRTCTVMTQPTQASRGSLFGKVPSLSSCFYNLRKPMSVPYMFSIAGVFVVAYWYILVPYPSRSTYWI